MAASIRLRSPSLPVRSTRMLPIAFTAAPKIGIRYSSCLATNRMCFGSRAKTKGASKFDW